MEFISRIFFTHNFSVDKIPSLDGKVCIVTGANTGIGKVTSKELARKGACVFMACRNIQRGQDAKNDILKEVPTANLEVMELDLSLGQSVVKFAKEFRAKALPIHILVNNAGLVSQFQLSPDGIELMFATNYVGHFLLTRLLLDIIIQSTPSRIVNVSSGGHKWSYKEGIQFEHISDEACFSSMKAYGQSKLANILFTKELTKRLGDKDVYVNAIHPGMVTTEIGRNSWMGKILVAGLTPETGALTSLYAATSPEIEEKKYKGEYFVPIGVLQASSALSNDAALQEKLWNFTEELIKTKMNPDFLPNMPC